MAGRKNTHLRRVLPADRFIALREDCLTYKQIGELVGYSETAIASYARRALPKRLRGHRPGAQNRNSANTPPPGAARCRDCLIVEGNLVRPVDHELRICSWCAMKRFGVDVRDFCESGLAIQMFGIPPSLKR